ncbi:MAG: nucleoside-diphosphate sugar epimerase/dehydratase [Myxococcota bacterium]
MTAGLSNKIWQRLTDLAVLSLAFWLAFFIRFDGQVPFQMFKRLMFTWPYVVGFQYIVLVAFGVPRHVWRYVSLIEARKIAAALLTASVIFVAIRFAAHAALTWTQYAFYALLPLGVIATDYVLALVGISGVRILRRMFAESSESRQRTPQVLKTPTMLIGAGQGGVMVAKEIAVRPQLGIKPVGFLDDDAAKVGSVVHGITVHGTTEKLRELCARHGARQVLVTIAHARGEAIRRIVRACEDAGLPVKIIPRLHELVGGNLNLSRLRDVAIEDLLGRDSVELDLQGIAGFIQDKCVLITGAGGSIGSELCRQVARFLPRRLVLVERFETALFDIHSELVAQYRDVDVTPCLADICDTSRMSHIFEHHNPTVIFHAAAHKHVPMVEWNPGEAIKNNVFGTIQVADMAAARNASHFVMISTDKAVNPSSVMGASKRVAELYIQSMAAKHPTKHFVSVRFGNVLGSNGSVIPIFKRQINNGGPVTITHPEMRRYFMTVPEASQLVLQAAALGRGGEVFILDMGEPVRIVDLAHDLIRLSGFEPGRDIEIAFTGVRPGEKLFEELATRDECAEKTRHPKVFIGRVQAADSSLLNGGLEELRRCTDAADTRRIYSALRRMVPEFSGRAEGALVVPITQEAHVAESG